MGLTLPGATRQTPAYKARYNPDSMKITTSFSRKFAVLATAFAIVITSVFSARPAQAGYIETLLRVGPDVVATGTGPIDLNGLGFINIYLNDNPQIAYIEPEATRLQTGATTIHSPDTYQATGPWIGPTNFGQGTYLAATSGTGDFAGIIIYAQIIIVPTGYVSGDPLSDSAIYSGQDFHSLGVNRGTYVWSWGAGVNQNFTLQIGPVGAPVPDSGSTFGLLGVALVALFGVTRFRSLRLA